MEFLNIGIPELVIIVLLMLILLGPEGMVKTARTLAQAVRKLIRSPLWADLMKAQNEIKDIPTRLVREAGIDELQAEMRQVRTEVSGEVNSTYQSIPAGPYGVYPRDPEPTDGSGDSESPVGPAPEELPAEERPVDGGEDQP